MATAVPYSEGVASISPSSTPPNDYQSSAAATPEAFGAGIGRGLEAVGAGAAKAADFYAHAAADDASNELQSYTQKLLHGDPNAPTTGPDGLPMMGADGKPMPDTGYLGTQGRAALDRRPEVEKAIDARIKEIGANLKDPVSQKAFEDFSRRYRLSVSERVSGHATTQATTWYTSVNTSSAKLAMEHIANNYDNPKELAAGAADLTAAYVKNAQLAGATPDSPQMKEAFTTARRDALDAQLNAMAVKDPSRALAILDKNRDLAGTKYDEMAARYRGRAKQQQGYDVAEQALKQTYADQSQKGGYSPAIYTQIGAPYGISGSYLQRTQQLETGGNPNQESSTGAKGPFQFVGSTAQRYGVKDPYDFMQSADGAARLAADNKRALADQIGRPPTDAELYLAHQQGARGAALLLANPNARAGDLLPPRMVNGKLVDPIKVNGGDPNAPASQFVSMWAAKFAGAPGMAYATRKAAAFQTIMSDPNIDPEVRQHALNHVNQQIQAQQIAEEQDAKAAKARQDALASSISSRIINGTAGPEIIGQIANSGLPAPEMQTLYKFAVGEGGIQDDQHYGPGYAAAFRQVLSNPDDPSHISRPIDIIARGGPGGDLTKKGVGELLGVMEKIKKQPDQAGIATTKSHLLTYYLDQFAIDQNSPLAGIPGVKPQRDQKGLNKFNRDFVPAFESAYSQWVGAGKDPMEFLTDNAKIDAIMNRVYPPSERAADAIKAQSGQQKPPPAPEGAPQDSWDRLMSDPPKLRAGGTMPLAQWGNILTLLRNDPSPNNKAIFDAKFGSSGYTADMVLKQVSAEKQPEAVTQPASSDPPKPGFFSRVGSAIEGVRKSNQEAIKKLEAQDRENERAAEEGREDIR